MSVSGGIRALTLVSPNAPSATPPLDRNPGSSAMSRHCRMASILSMELSDAPCLHRGWQFSSASVQLLARHVFKSIRCDCLNLQEGRKPKEPRWSQIYLREAVTNICALRTKTQGTGIDYISSDMACHVDSFVLTMHLRSLPVSPSRPSIAVLPGPERPRSRGWKASTTARPK